MFFASHLRPKQFRLVASLLAMFTNVLIAYLAFADNANQDVVFASALILLGLCTGAQLVAANLHASCHSLNNDLREKTEEVICLHQETDRIIAANNYKHQQRYDNLTTQHRQTRADNSRLEAELLLVCQKLGKYEPQAQRPLRDSDLTADLQRSSMWTDDDE